ncbi:omega-hydroxypalmitate O-feruloyl transferase [Cajanus cajan]|uniref:Taxadien-5-alpha-ol O-acetyltransferase n=1 Tax=Cajanus cajan TaxID=3821 RepID=A0A151RM92_CAJCA|nr:omega-hydroxypalmitate O-feruloyl transferase [Cajanus cajan]KYP43687.1 Taxadien-5-alpha-ol O-acetyltransferase [Cajanus cajan]
MSKSMELPDCVYPKPAFSIIPPCAPTPKHSLYLSNLDNQKFLRFSIKYVYLFKKCVSLDVLKSSLSRVLVDYYPLAGRLRRSSSIVCEDDDHKLEVDCNGQGAFFAEASMDATAQELLELCKLPNDSWRKLLYKVEAQSFLDVPPLVIQVTRLGCGGMILCTAINHCLCDGIGTSQFLKAWAHLTQHPNAELTTPPIHTRHVLKLRDPPQVHLTHPQYTRINPTQVDLHALMFSQPLVPTSFTFGPSQVLRLKNRYEPSPKRVTTFEAVAAHTWRAWVKSLNPCPTLTVKLLFSVNVREKMKLPEGYYGNGFVLACAESVVRDLVAAGNLRHGLEMVQRAKARLDEGRVWSMVDLLEDETVGIDLSSSFVISQWSRLGLEEVDFGEGKALHVGPLTSSFYCLILPIVGDPHAVRVLVSVPETVADTFRYHMALQESLATY